MQAQAAQPRAGRSDADAPPPTTLDRRRIALACALAALAVALPTLRNGFAIDDFYVFVNQPRIRDLGSIPGFFRGGWTVGSADRLSNAMNTHYYRPIATTLAALEVAAFGLRPVWFHAVSALLHSATAALVSLLLWRLGKGSRTVALVGGVLFAVHPVQSEAFSAACYQTTLLAGLFGTLALLAFGRILDEGVRARRLLLLAGTLLLGLLSKEEAFAVPLVAGAWAVVLRPDGWRKRLLAAGATMAIPVAVVLLLRSVFLTRSTVLYFPPDAPAFVVVLTMVRVAALYAELLLLPIRLCPFYDWFIVGFETGLSAGVVTGAAVLGLCLVLIARGVRRSPLVALGLAWGLLALAPVSQVIPIIVVAAERFLYLAMIGVALVAGLLARELLARARAAGRTRLAVAVCAVPLALLAGRTLARVPDWRDNETLNRATARAFPETPTPLLNLATHYRDVVGDDDKALEALAEAEKRVPGWKPARERAAEIRARRER